jgi:hypothetical protein
VIDEFMGVCAGAPKARSGGAVTCEGRKRRRSRRRGVVRDGLLGSVGDCCEWHAGGTAGDELIEAQLVWHLARRAGDRYATDRQLTLEPDELFALTIQMRSLFEIFLQSRVGLPVGI